MTNSKYVMIMLFFISIFILMLERWTDRAISGQEATLTTRTLTTFAPSYPQTVQTLMEPVVYDYSFVGDPQKAKIKAFESAYKKLIECELAQPGKTFRAKARLCPRENKFLVTIYQVK